MVRRDTGGTPAAQARGTEFEGTYAWWGLIDLGFEEAAEGDMGRDAKAGESIGTRAPMTIRAFARAIRRLPSDSPIDQPGIWYRTQKEHWLGWLSEYHGPGAYGRSTKVRRDAAYAYNHIVETKMLLWLIKAAGVGRSRVATARQAAGGRKSLASKSGAVRGVVPWGMVELALRTRPRPGR